MTKQKTICNTMEPLWNNNGSTDLERSVINYTKGGPKDKSVLIIILIFQSWFKTFN